MSFHRMQKLAAATPRASVEVNQSFVHCGLELIKIAEAGGHWRRLQPDQTGHDRAGNETRGKTWVTTNRMRAGMKPMEHQEDFDEAAKQRLGGKGGGGIIAAHGTGTGKTFSAINTFENLKGEGKARRALVVVPAGLRDNFLAKGVQKFTTSKGVILAKPQAVDPSVEYVVVSYAAFRADPEGWLDKVKPDTIIADEVQRAGNPESKTYKSLMWARQQVPHFMGLTASIAQNSPADIVPLVALAEKGEQQIKDKKEFKKRYVKKTPSEQKGVFGGQTYEKKLVRQAELNARVGASVHYVEDLDASKKPAKDVEMVEVKMSKEQLKYYKMSMKGVDPVVLKKIREGKEVSQRQAMNIFTSLMRARQVSNSLHIAAPGMDAAQAAEATPKIKKILDDAVEHIKTTPDAQIVMYTNMVHGGVDVLTAGLKARGIPFGVFAGTGVQGVTNDTRNEAVERYLSGEDKVIVITGAGAEGLSLGNTTMVQLADGHYNPERMAQAEARGVRAGGLSHRDPKDRRVRVKRYVSALPKNFWQTITFKQPDRSVGQFVYLTADRKDRLNRQLRDVLKNRSEHESKKRDSFLYRHFGGGP
jgi:SNF2 family DNA or RNA helicase